MPKALELLGKRFGRLEVVGKSPIRKGGVIAWNCVCDCGAKTIVRGTSLANGNTRSCGCLELENRVANVTKNKLNGDDIVGVKYGRITVVSTNVYNHKTIAVGQCECGNTWEGVASVLIRGGILSCGCLASELLGARVTTHGFTKGRSNTREYRAWQAMTRRCYDTNHKDYPYYGARGITVCDEWRFDAERFYADMGDCPPDFTLDRIDNSQGYSKENCRWADRKTQANNSRKARMLEIDGVTQSITAWSEQSSVAYRTILSRLKLGWSPKDAVFKPIKYSTSVAIKGASSRVASPNKPLPAGAIRVRGLNA
jgi:hypothetical protein